MASACGAIKILSCCYLAFVIYFEVYIVKLHFLVNDRSLSICLNIIILVSSVRPLWQKLRTFLM